MLTQAQLESFAARGYLSLSAVFPRDVARRCVERACRERGFDERDPSTFPFGHGQLDERGREGTLETFAPAAWRAAAQLVGGPDRVVAPPEVTDGFVVNARFGHPRPWCPPTPEFGVWHIDSGTGFHRLADTSRQVALVVILHFHDEEPHAGGTFVVPDSVPVVSRYLAAHPEGVRNDESTDYLGFLAKDCRDFTEHTARAGDATLLHPFLLHGQSRNPSGRARFILNLHVALNEDFDLSGAPSPVEKAIAVALEG